MVKTLSARKADKEGHSADVLCDALFRATVSVRFRRLGETQAHNVDKLLSSIVESLGALSSSGLIVTADRGYGRMSLLRCLSALGIHSMFIMPSHLNKCHPFVGKSYLRVDRMDLEDADSDEPDELSDESSTSESSQSEAANVAEQQYLVCVTCLHF